MNIPDIHELRRKRNDAKVKEQADAIETAINEAIARGETSIPCPDLFVSVSAELNHKGYIVDSAHSTISWENV